MNEDEAPATYIVATPNLSRVEADPRDESNKPDDFDYDGPLPQWWLVSAAGSTVNFVAITYCPFCGEDLNADLLGEDEEDDDSEEAEKHFDLDLVHEYEEASGNTVKDGKIIDSSGRYICDYSDDFAAEYLNDDTGEDDWAGDEEENGTEMGPCPRCQGVLKNIGKDLVCTGDCKTIWWCEPLTQPTLGNNDFRFLSPGGDCPACRKGTIHIHTSSKGAQSATCMGECGGVWNKRAGIWRSAEKTPRAPVKGTVLSDYLVRDGLCPECKEGTIDVNFLDDGTMLACCNNGGPCGRIWELRKDAWIVRVP